MFFGKRQGKEMYPGGDCFAYVRTATGLYCFSLLYILKHGDIGQEPPFLLIGKTLTFPEQLQLKTAGGIRSIRILRTGIRPSCQKLFGSDLKYFAKDHDLIGSRVCFPSLPVKDGMP